MLYTGRFKNRNEETIQVNIITNNNTSQETELTFVNESPVIISQSSSDGIFSPIKSRSCTITIVTSEPYYDMYSGTSHGTQVTVNNLGTGECLFYGYLTPCEYNQPLLYLNEIELEAVDAVSTLQDFKYNYQNNYSSERVSISSVVRYCLNNIAGYQGGIFVPEFGLKTYNAYNNNFYPFEIEYISEEAFFDDGDPMTCYEVLEEICNFYNVSLLPFGDDVYFIDYESITNYNKFDSDNIYLNWKDLATSNIEQIQIPKIIGLIDYAGDDQNIELDEVYNKVSVKADIDEIEDDELLYNPMDDVTESAYYHAVNNYTELNGDNWTYVTRLFELKNNTKWRTYVNCNLENAGTGHYTLGPRFTKQYTNNFDSMTDHPYSIVNIVSGYLFNRIVGQTCMLAQQFGYQSNKEMPYSSNWDDMLLFFPQIEWIAEYYDERGYVVKLPNWYNFYDEEIGRDNPVLVYTDNKEIQYSPSDDTKTNFLAFTGDLLFQDNFDNGYPWSIYKENHKYGATLMMNKVIYTDNIPNIYDERNVGDTDYNKGWNALYIKIKIGDKYWNGNTIGNCWTTTETCAWIPYHKENVVNEPEKLIWRDFNKPVTNLNYKYKIGKDAFCIPITKSDNLYGKLQLEIYMPLVPAQDGIWYVKNGGSITPHPPQGNIGQTVPKSFYINCGKSASVIYMKNLSLELLSSDNDIEKWYMDFSDLKKDNDDDIIYSNEINSQNITEMDDLELKINTYNDKKPIANTYIIEPEIVNGVPNIENSNYHTCDNNNGFYRPIKGTTKREEINVVDRYVEHYSSPKKIYNCQVHNYYEPWMCVKPNALNNIKMIVDEQEYDVKSNTNNLKLIEY